MTLAIALSGNPNSQACADSEWTYGKGALQLATGLLLDLGPRWVSTGVSIFNILETIFAPATAYSPGWDNGGSGGMKGGPNK